MPLHYGEMSVEDVKDLSKHHELEKLADTTAYWSVHKENSRRLDTVQACKDTENSILGESTGKESWSTSMLQKAQNLRLMVNGKDSVCEPTPF